MEIESYPDAFGECRYWRHTPMQKERAWVNKICVEELHDDTPRHLLSGTVNAQFRIRGCGSFVPYLDDKYVVMAEETGNVQLFTVTASSEEEEKQCRTFSLVVLWICNNSSNVLPDYSRLQTGNHLSVVCGTIYMCHMSSFLLPDMHIRCLEQSWKP